MTKRQKFKPLVVPIDNGSLHLRIAELERLVAYLERERDTLDRRVSRLEPQVALAHAWTARIK